MFGEYVNAHTIRNRKRLALEALEKLQKQKRRELVRYKEAKAYGCPDEKYQGDE